ncbi:hypothetical protein GCM10022288_30850 [Gryllotalpicola kribbensis]|uniref:Uncharacterized protein n=1 Tax=Gryllotalpicola kribbensis TaxID=993084 RepID=A0ABP8B0E0_9MICO
MIESSSGAAGFSSSSAPIFAIAADISGSAARMRLLTPNPSVLCFDGAASSVIDIPSLKIHVTFDVLP